MNTALWGEQMHPAIKARPSDCHLSTSSLLDESITRPFRTAIPDRAVPTQASKSKTVYLANIASKNSSLWLHCDNQKRQFPQLPDDRSISRIVCHQPLHEHTNTHDGHDKANDPTNEGNIDRDRYESQAGNER
jgi:hypothetical protein